MEILASKASRRRKCPGSLELETLYGKEAYQDKENSIVKQTALAYLLMANSDIWDPAYPLVGEIIEGIPLTLEMLEAAKLFNNYVLNIVGDEKINITIDPFLFLNIQFERIECKLDAYFISENKSIHFFKFDYGMRSIEVFENWEMLEAATAFLQTREGFNLKECSFHFHVIQPRSFHPDGKIRVWIIDGLYLQNYIKEIFKFEIDAFQDDAPQIPNDECIRCDARLHCEALKNASVSIGEYAHQGITPELSPMEIGNELKFLKDAEKILKARVDALETEAFHRIKKGVQIPHFYLGRGRGAQKWKYEDATIITMAALLGVEIGKSYAITPKQALDAGIDPQLIADWSEEIEGKTKLCSMDESKPKRIFNKEK